MTYLEHIRNIHKQGNGLVSFARNLSEKLLYTPHAHEVLCFSKQLWEFVALNIGGLHADMTCGDYILRRIDDKLTKAGF